MILNHNRTPVWKWQGEESLCPDCQGQLIARRGDIVVWHWAHHARLQGRQICGHSESEWHLRMKLAYLNFQDWEIEVPIQVGGRKLRLDARSKRTEQIREFVHSLSPYYVEKHYLLKTNNCKVLWIFDGEEFRSLRAFAVRGGGQKNFLKPSAYETWEWTGGLVHWNNKLWRNWRGNIWYPCTGPLAREVCSRFEMSRNIQETQYS